MSDAASADLHSSTASPPGASAPSGSLPSAPDRGIGPLDSLEPLARGPVFGAMAALAVLLAATSDWYGFHRDELYFRMLEPAWGYVDQPPLTPLLTRAIASVVDEPWALRIPAILAAVATVYVLALIAREAGGGRRAQSVAAWAAASASFPMVFGHVLLTASIDLVVWPLVALFTMRALLRDGERSGRWWLAVGLVVGVATYNKLLVVLLVAGIGIGLLVVGPWRALRSPWLWAGVGVAVVVALPNLAYQVANDLPQLRMGAALAEDSDGEARLLTLPFLLLLAGPPLVPIWIAGLVALLRRPAWRPIRLLAVAFAVVVIATIAGGAQPYYPVGLIEVLLALGAVPTAEWMRTTGRRALVWAGIALNAVVSALIALPLLPLGLVGASPFAAMNQTVGDSIGWPTYVEQVATVVHGAGASSGSGSGDGRADAASDPVVITSNYGEAGAIARYGEEFGLDPDAVYSGHNALWFEARPPDAATDVIFVGDLSPRTVAAFESCTTAGRLDNGVDVDNEEQGLPITLCRGRTVGWDELWPRLAHLS
ncbi:glycosyltransferase family 39 protein [Agromyces sp. Marseille-Q5079]|uniref:glycosyltransferase family 39 protein n=1 Tax=Agromyces sp. Marseille-Q5079 TaxID=3439059 RepID=UPI003D9C9B7F